jgi:phosphatidylserine/phosphatidylglycerophosphate/cardiolipin synthase-like enzyme
MIHDLEKFTENTRKIVFCSFGKNNEENKDYDNIILYDLSDEDRLEMDQILSQKESKQIILNNIRKQHNKKTGQIRYVFTDKSFSSIIEDLNSRMVSNLLKDLTVRGLIESAYDSELNDFVFWIKEDASIKNNDSNN